MDLFNCSCSDLQACELATLGDVTPEVLTSDQEIHMRDCKWIPDTNGFSSNCNILNSRSDPSGCV
jgi:hypothetical protein